MNKQALEKKEPKPVRQFIDSQLPTEVVERLNTGKRVLFIGSTLMILKRIKHLTCIESRPTD